VLASNELSVRTPGQSARKVNISAEPESMSPFEARMIGGTAYVYLFSFSPFDAQQGEDRFAENIEVALSELMLAKPTGWVLDLRNNRGGSIPTLSFMAASFGYTRTVAEISSRNGPHQPRDRSWWR
jgi:C-terminal processing protease CtpA/Prc